MWKHRTAGSWSWPTTAVALVSFLKKRKQKKAESLLSAGPLRAARNQTCMSYEAGREALCHISSLESWIRVWEEAKKELGQLPRDGCWHKAGEFARLACLKLLQKWNEIAGTALACGNRQNMRCETTHTSRKSELNQLRSQQRRETALKLGQLTVYPVKCNLYFLGIFWETYNNHFSLLSIHFAFK